ncbi:MAG: hypothetical protein ACREBV_03280 [Candidatus Zixiibacteriota bacterium]
MGTFYNLVETDYERALEEFGLAKSELHNDPELLRSIAFVQLRQGRFLEAQGNYHKAAELDPLNPVRYADESYSLECTHSYIEAEQALKRAITLDPGLAQWHSKMIRLYVRWYGEWPKIEPVVIEALKHSDTLGLLTGNWWWTRWLPELPWEKLLSDYIVRIRDTLDLPMYFDNVASGYDFMKDTAKSLLYIDSARKIREIELKENPGQLGSSYALGLNLAYLGDCERAVELGQKAKELLSVDECHY